MSTKPPGRALIDPAVQSKIADFFLQRGGKSTAFCLVGAALAMIGLAVFERDVKAGLTGIFWLSLAMAYGSLFWTGKRTNDMVATGIGEIKKESPNLSNESADPAINRVIAKLENGVPPTGTTNSE